MRVTSQLLSGFLIRSPDLLPMLKGDIQYGINVQSGSSSPLRALEDWGVRYGKVLEYRKSEIFILTTPFVYNLIII